MATETAPVSSKKATPTPAPSSKNGGTPAPAPPKGNTAYHRVEKGESASDIGKEYGNQGKAAEKAINGKVKTGDVVEVELSDKAQKNRKDFDHADAFRKNFGAFDTDGNGEVSQQEVRDGKKLKGKELDNYLQDTYGETDAKILERRREAYVDASRYYSQDENYAMLAQASKGDETDGVTVADAQRNREDALEKLPEQQRERLEAADNRGAIRTINRDFNNFDTANKGGMGDGNISENDLRAVLDNPEADARSRMAAQYLLDNRDRLGKLDKDGGDIDIKQSDLDSGLTAANRETLNSALRPERVKEYRAQQGKESAQLLDKSFKKFAGEDGSITRDDLRTVLNADRGEYSADERDAARYLLQNPEYFHGADTAFKNDEADGTISQDDIRQNLTDTERAYRDEFADPKAQKRFQAQELGALRGLDNYFLHNGQDLSLENLRRLAESGDAREQKSASFFLKNLGELYALDGAADDSRRVDDRITSADVQELLAQVR